MTILCSLGRYERIQCIQAISSRNRGDNTNKLNHERESRGTLTASQWEDRGGLGTSFDADSCYRFLLLGPIRAPSSILTILTSDFHTFITPPSNHEIAILPIGPVGVQY